MCICSSEGTLSNTKIYVGEAERNGKLVHVLAYQNNAESKYGVPNSMILPFPTSVPMSQENVIDTSSFKDFLQNIADATKIQMRSLGKSMAFSADALDADVFDVGSYTVILATKASQIPKALEKVPENKRPGVTHSLLQGFDTLYPGQPLAVCCWSGSVEAEPLLWWYEPTDKDTLFVPTMDAHDGLAPKVEANVETDHIISVGTASRSRNVSKNVVHYSDTLPPSVKSLLPECVWGVQLPGRMKNGDGFVKVAEVIGRSDGRLGVPNIKRGISPERTHSTVPMYGWHA